MQLHGRKHHPAPGVVLAVGVVPASDVVQLVEIERAGALHGPPDPAVAGITAGQPPWPAQRQEIGAELVGTSDAANDPAHGHGDGAQVAPPHLAVSLQICGEAANGFCRLGPWPHHRGASSSLMETPYAWGWEQIGGER